MGKLTIHRKASHRKGGKRKAFTRADGTHVAATNFGPSEVPASTFQITDQGAPGRTPPGDQWYNSQVKTGWNKNEAPATRRKQMLKAHNGNVLASARALQALANVTIDPATKRAAEADAQYFYAENRAKGGTHRISRRRELHISPRMKPLR